MKIANDKTTGNKQQLDNYCYMYVHGLFHRGYCLPERDGYSALEKVLIIYQAYTVHAMKPTHRGHTCINHCDE